MPEPVELHPAYQWDCPTCGREQFCRSIVAEITEEDRVAMDLEPFEQGSWLTYPEELTCKDCGETFATRHMNEADPDDQEN